MVLRMRVPTVSAFFTTTTVWWKVQKKCLWWKDSILTTIRCRRDLCDQTTAEPWVQSVVADGALLPVTTSCDLLENCVLTACPLTPPRGVPVGQWGGEASPPSVVNNDRHARWATNKPRHDRVRLMDQMYRSGVRKYRQTKLVIGEVNAQLVDSRRRILQTTCVSPFWTLSRSRVSVVRQLVTPTWLNCYITQQLETPMTDMAQPTVDITAEEIAAAN